MKLRFQFLVAEGKEMRHGGDKPKPAPRAANRATLRTGLPVGIGETQERRLRDIPALRERTGGQLSANSEPTRRH